MSAWKPNLTVECLAAHQLFDEIELLPSKSLLQRLEISVYSFTEGTMTQSMGESCLVTLLINLVGIVPQYCKSQLLKVLPGTFSWNFS